MAAAGTAATQVLNLNGLAVSRGLQRRPGAERHRRHDGQRRVDPRRRHARRRRQLLHRPTTRSTPGTAFDVLQNGVTGSTGLRGTLTYVRPDGEVVTADYLAQETATGCVFAGTAIG